MKNEQEYIEHLEQVAKQRSALMAIISGIFLSPTKTEEEAHMKAGIAMTIMTAVEEHGCRVGDFIEIVTMEAAQKWVKEQIEIEKLKALAEGREWEE